MNKPFDIQDLLARLKSKGLDAAEEVLKVVATETLDWAAESCALHENVFVKFGGPVIAGAKPALIKEIDKLDGQAG